MPEASGKPRYPPIKEPGKPKGKPAEPPIPNKPFKPPPPPPPPVEPPPSNKPPLRVLGTGLRGDKDASVCGPHGDVEIIQQRVELGVVAKACVIANAFAQPCDRLIVIGATAAS
jgi:hypothetical protein